MAFSMMAALAGALVFATGMLMAALMDLTSMKIPNLLVLALLVAYVVLAPLSGLGFSAIGTSLAVGVAVLVGGFLLFALGWIGGGDVKLAAATALWLGVDHTLTYLLYTALIGGGLTLFLLQFRLVPLPASLLGHEWIARLHATRTGVPYGVAMAAAALILLPGTSWLVAL